MRKIKTTLRDVAARAGVSNGLVSIFFRDQTYRHGGTIGVSEETGARILAAARALNYQPTKLAARLKLYPNCGGLAMLLGKNASEGFTSFYSEILFGAVSSDAKNINVNVSTFDIDVDYLAHPEKLPFCANDNHTSKFMIVGGENYSLALALQKLGHSVCYLLRESNLENTISVAPDYELAAYEGIKYLFECGHREVAMIGEFYCRENGNASGSYYGRNYHTPLLINGAKRAFQEFGKVFVPENDFFINRKDALSDSPTYYAELMEKRPEVTAVFCVCDASADGFYTQVLKAGRRVPDDISVMGICRNRIGFSQIDFCAMINPLRDIGSLAMKLLDDGGDGKKSHMLPCYFNPGTTVKKLG